MARNTVAMAIRPTIKPTYTLVMTRTAAATADTENARFYEFAPLLEDNCDDLRQDHGFRRYRRPA